MSKFTNPLFTEDRVSSESGSKSVSVSAAMDVESPEVCPKCGNQTVPVTMADMGAAHFCDRCRVTMPALEAK